MTIVISGTITPSSPLDPPTLYTAAAATIPGNHFFIISLVISNPGPYIDPNYDNLGPDNPDLGNADPDPPDPDHPYPYHPGPDHPYPDCLILIILILRTRF